MVPLQGTSKSGICSKTRCREEEKEMANKHEKIQELMAKVNSKDVNEILAQAKKMGFDDLTAEDIMAEFNLSDEALDKVSGGIKPPKMPNLP